ncbi:sensor histidine kinase [Pleionea sp. CnH1-48]|uniref:sensor histidine kinase n=1 Tax=Pleionea sp. CnH1-48 TaxID=2954494 RepID=UPI002096F933|nr:ATP-binding protein [Pleionea sp. CnH1-48]MCO7223735.1 ATP-binding protein [Pleionea sp. CnH1-48]
MMADIEVYKRALEREKKARQSAEKMLDEKSREVFTNMLLIQQQFEDLQQRKSNLELLVTVSKFTQEEKKFVESIEEFASIVGEFSSVLFTELHMLDQEISEGNVEKNELNQAVSEAVKTGHSVSMSQGETDVCEELFTQPDLIGIHAIPIKCYSKVVAVIEVGVSDWKQFPQSIQDSASVAASQLGIALERRLSTKQTQKNHEELIKTHESLKLAQQQLVNSEKLASIGQLSAGVAHEINNPIGFVISNINTLGEYIDTLVSLIRKYESVCESQSVKASAELKDQIREIEHYRDQEDIEFLFDDIGDMLEESANGMRRVKDIVSSLKNFARTGNHQRAEADINQCLENTIKVVWNDVKYTSQIEPSLADIPPVMCNIDELSQVFLNLIINANQAMEEGGVILIKTWQEKERVYIQIADNGCGIPEDKLNNIFDPFFTTKPVGVGTGLGLSIAYGIIEEHGGKISVESEINKGTCFTIELPINESESSASAIEAVG